MIKNKKAISILMAGIMGLSFNAMIQNAYAYSNSIYPDRAEASPHETEDSKGVKWSYFKLKDGTISLYGTRDLSSTMEIPAELDGYKVSEVGSIVGYVNEILPESKSVGDAINKVIIPYGVKKIGEIAFNKCTNLTDIEIPSTVESIGEDAFRSEWLDAHRNSDGFVIINGILVDGRKCKGDIVIPSNVWCIGTNAFKAFDDGYSSEYECTNLTSVTIPAGVKRIDKGAFNGTNLKNVVLPDGIEVIGEEAFKSTNMSSIKIPGSVKRIGDYAFADCSSLEKIDIADGVECIGKGAFQELNITGIDIPASVKNIEDNAFYQCYDLSNVKFNEGTVIGCETFKNTSWLDNMSYKNGFKIYNGVLLQVDTGLKGDIEIPEGVREIAGESFFRGLSYKDNVINDIKIPEGVTMIGNYAFVGCNIAGKVYIPASMKVMDETCFENYNSIIFEGPGAEVAKKAAPINTNLNKEEEKVQPGWSYINNEWYYGNSDGSKFTGWLSYSGNWYYFYGNGQMATGFIDLGDDAFYYLDESGTSSIGIMKSGWQKINGYWYYFNTSSDSGITGMMKKGWTQIGGNWYYFYYGDGIMAHDTWIDGYYVNSNGQWVK